MEEIFARTLEVVSGTAGISPELILSKDRHEEVVDARCLLVYILSQQGLYPSAIARYTRLSIRTVNSTISSFAERADNRRMLAVNLEKTQRKLGRNSAETDWY